MHFTCKCRGGEEKRGGEGRGEGRKGSRRMRRRRSWRGFDAMQTGSTKARRQKFSTHHKNKSACVPALAQSDCKGQHVTKPLNPHGVTSEMFNNL